MEQLFGLVRRGAVELVSSEALEDEVSRNPSWPRRIEAERLLSLAAITIDLDEQIIGRAQGLVRLGYGPFDALHIASAESVGCDVLLTNDDVLLKRTARKLGTPRIRMRNPVFWIKEPGQ